MLPASVYLQSNPACHPDIFELARPQRSNPELSALARYAPHSVKGPPQACPCQPDQLHPPGPHLTGFTCLPATGCLQRAHLPCGTQGQPTLLTVQPSTLLPWAPHLALRGGQPSCPGLQLYVSVDLTFPVAGAGYPVISYCLGDPAITHRVNGGHSEHLAPRLQRDDSRAAWWLLWGG